MEQGIFKRDAGKISRRTGKVFAPAARAAVCATLGTACLPALPPPARHPINPADRRARLRGGVSIVSGSSTALQAAGHFKAQIPRPWPPDRCDGRGAHKETRLLDGPRWPHTWPCRTMHCRRPKVSRWRSSAALNDVTAGYSVTCRESNRYVCSAEPLSDKGNLPCEN
jgi:hypothetical protein